MSTTAPGSWGRYPPARPRQILPCRDIQTLALPAEPQSVGYALRTIISRARKRYAMHTLPTWYLAVEADFSPAAAAFCTAWPEGDLRKLITQILQQDPRPAYARNYAAPKRYGMKLYDFDLHWELRGDTATVTDLIRPALQNQCADQSDDR